MLPLNLIGETCHRTKEKINGVAASNDTEAILLTIKKKEKKRIPAFYIKISNGGYFGDSKVKTLSAEEERVHNK